LSPIAVAKGAVLRKAPFTTYYGWYQSVLLDPDGISAKATPEELRAEIAKRVVMLAEKGYVDLEALPRPAHMNEEGTIADAEDQQEESDYGDGAAEPAART
jgi:hypothetical protein